MSLSFTNSWAMALLAALPLVWWLRGRTLTNFHPRQLLLQALLRSIVIGGLALALAQPVFSFAGKRLSVVYLIDASSSIADDAVTGAVQWVEETNRAIRPERAETVLVGAAPRAVDSGAAVDAALKGEQFDRTATNVEAGLRDAMSRLATGHLQRIVLMTDGHETAGKLSRQIPLLQQAGVRVFTRPLAPKPGTDSWIATAEAPDVVSAGEPFATTVHVYSQTARSVNVLLRASGKTLSTERVDLTQGDNTITVNARAEDLGTHVLEVVIDDPADPSPANNVLRRPLAVEPKPRVLYVEGRPTSAGYLTRALEDGGFAVDLTTASRLPASSTRLSGYAAIIVSDVHRDDLPDPKMRALKEYVQQRGGGLVLAGGESVFGIDGYAKTTIEEIMPVTFSMKDKPDEFAMVVVLDKSWSMSGPKMELSKEAAKAAVDVLSDTHQFALIAFNNEWDWPVTMQLAKNRVEIQSVISQIVPNGGTNIFPALEESFKALLKVEAKTKHVILLSDGRTYTDDFEGLTKKMVDAKISVSSIAVGDQSDRELLADIAKWGKGRGYYIEDATGVPQIMTDETKEAKKPTLVEEPFRALVEKPSEIFRGIDFTTAPTLRGYTNTQVKEEAELLLGAPEKDEEKQPILARWQYGLGRTAAFLSDVKDRWATDWLSWPGYGKFWNQLVRDVMRQDAERDQAFRVERDGDVARITIRRLQEDGTFENLQSPTIEVTTGSGPATTISAQQSGPGTYGAVVPLSGRDDVRFTWAGATPEATVTRVLPANYNPELRAAPPNEGLLRDIAENTGGTYSPSAEDIAADRGETTEVRHHVWPYLALVALLAYLGDLLLRRVRLFDHDAVA